MENDKNLRKIFYSDEKNSVMTSKMMTKISEHDDLLSINLEKLQPRYAQDEFQMTHLEEESVFHVIGLGSSLKMFDVQESSSKIDELENKTSKFITKFSDMNKKIMRTYGLTQTVIDRKSKLTLNGSIYTNKLKIIKDLEQKIELLESTINNPLGRDEMKSIEHDINRNFESYYQQAEINPHQDHELSSDSDGEQPKIDSPLILFKPNNQTCQIKENAFSKYKIRNECETQTSIISHQQSVIKKVDEIQIMIEIPKFIEILIPYEVIQLKDKCISHKSETPQNSIDQMINQFNRKYENEGKTLNEYKKQIYEYRILESQNNHSSDKVQFNLPIDSFEGSRNSSIERKRHQAKYTDRSNISDNNSLEIDRIQEQVWSKDELHFNQINFKEVKDAYQKSQESAQKQIEREDQIIQMEENIIHLTQNLQNTRLLLAERNKDLQAANQNNQQLESKSGQMQAQFLKLQEKCDNLLEENRQINNCVISLKEEVFKLQQTQKELTYRLKVAENQIAKKQQKIHHKDQQIEILHGELYDKAEQNQQMNRINDELRQLIKLNEEKYEKQCLKNESDLNDLKQEINFYKNRLEEEGDLNLKLEQACQIQDIIEQKQKSYKKIIKDQEIQYNNLLTTYSKEKHHFEAERIRINDLLKKQDSKLALKTKIQKQLKQILTEYDDELHKKDKQILQLKQLSIKYKGMVKSVQSNTTDELCLIQNIKQIINNQQRASSNDSNLYLEFFYFYNKLLNQIKLLECLHSKQKQQKFSLTKKYTNLHIYMNKQLEKSEIVLNKINNENQKLRKLVEDYKNQNKRNLNKVEIYKKHIYKSGEGGNANIYRIENEFLQKENIKLIEKSKKLQTYIQKLENELLHIFKKEQITCSHHELFLSYLRLHDQETKLEEEMKEVIYNQYMEQLKQEYQKNYSEIEIIRHSTLHESSRIDKNKNITIVSSVVAINNKPASQSVKPKNGRYPKNVSSIPAQDAIPNTIEKMALKRQTLPQKSKIVFCLKLIELGIQLVKFSKKLFSLKPSQIVVNNFSEEKPEQMSIVVQKQFGNRMQQDEGSLLYRAPQVLLGFNQSQLSYVWTIGLMIDQMFHNKLFYKKFDEILSHKNNYYCRDQQLYLGPMLERMLKKNQKDRLPLNIIKDEIQKYYSIHY